MTLLERIRQSMEEDYNISIKFIETRLDRLLVRFRINPDPEGFRPDKFNLDMIVKHILADGEIQAEVSLEKAQRRYRIEIPKEYPERIRRVLNLAFKGTGVTIKEIVQPNPRLRSWDVLLNYPEGTIFRNTPFFIIRSCTATEVLLDFDMDDLERLEQDFVE